MLSRIDYFSDTQRLQRFKRVVIDVAGSGDNTIVAAVTGKIIRVYQVVLIAAGTVVTTWQSGAGGTPITGGMTLAVNTGYAPPWCPAGHFQTAEGALLNLSLSAAVSVDGWLIYAEV